MRVSLGLLVLLAACSSPMTMDNPEQGRNTMYSFSEVQTATPSRLVQNMEVQVSPILNYDLPHVPLSFKLRLVNRSTEVIYIGNPLPPLALRFNAPDSRLIEVPMNQVGPAIRPPQPGNFAAIAFKKANENGTEVAVEPDGYQIGPGDFLEITFETEQVISERILAALEKSKEKFVDVVLTMRMMNLRDRNDGASMRSERIRLPIPKPEG